MPDDGQRRFLRMHSIPDQSDPIPIECDQPPAGGTERGSNKWDSAGAQCPPLEAATAMWLIQEKQLRHPIGTGSEQPMTIGAENEEGCAVDRPSDGWVKRILSILRDKIPDQQWRTDPTSG